MYKRNIDKSKVIEESNGTVKSNAVENKRLNSTKEYIDGLQEQYSKLLVVRVDLGYTKECSKKIELDDVNKDLKKMLNNRRSKPSTFKNNVGYICKKEYTEDKGVHLHTLFLYDGQKVQKDAYIADEIGKYWNALITNGRGVYHNCNRNNYKDSGIGMLDHKDTEKREILDTKVISYLCKDDENQDIAPVKSNKKDRAFVRSTIKKKTKSIGRPRTK